MKAPRRSRLRGFSLIEAVVTLVIVALLVVVLMQALGQTLGVRERVIRFQRATRVDMLQEQWFRQTIAAAIPDLRDAFGSIEGDGKSLDLLTVAPLSGQGLQRVQWRLVQQAGGYALRYREGDRDLVVVPGPLENAEFDYLDHDGQWKREWKPAAGDELVMPSQVRLQARLATGVLYWQVPIPTDPRIPKLLRPDDPANGL